MAFQFKNVLPNANFKKVFHDFSHLVKIKDYRKTTSFRRSFFGISNSENLNL